jgi:hypothetical protein
MKALTIHLQDELYAELVEVSAPHREMTFGPEQWAQEAVESALAVRRLPRFTKPQSRPRHRELETYSVLLPHSGRIAEAE